MLATNTNIEKPERQRGSPARESGTAAIAEVTEGLVLEYTIV